MIAACGPPSRARGHRRRHRDSFGGPPSSRSGLRKLPRSVSRDL